MNDRNQVFLQITENKGLRNFINTTKHSIDMSDYTSVVLITPELLPFAQTGGLGDMLESLGPTLQDSGLATTYILPKYQCIATEGLEDLGTIVSARIWRGRHPSRITTYFVDIPTFFDRPGLYGEHGQDYPDNFLRFAAFARAAIETIRTHIGPSDIIHCHDWQTAMVPLLLKTVYTSDPIFRNSRTIFTIHNLGYQGIFPAEEFASSGLPPHCFQTLLEYYGKMNLLKGAILSADGITTVSPSYAQEVLTPELGYGLDGVLSSRSHHFRGILNGINTHEWDPQHNPNLPAPYSASDLSGKKLCKRALQERMGLPKSDDIIVISMICRLVSQKGVDLVIEAVPSLSHLPIQWVLLGNGEAALEKKLTALAAQYPQQVSATIGFHAELSHIIEAGSDLFLMPSRYEPCGYNQMYSQHYGTLPIARATGGLKDTVIDVSLHPTTGTGFVFHDTTALALRDCILRAVQFCGKREQKEAAMRRAMMRDFSWRNSVKQFISFYQEILSHAPHQDTHHG